MGRTVVALDVTRRELTETPLSKRRRAKNFLTGNGGKNLIFQWPGTGSYTLQPINMTCDFSETRKWELLKLDLGNFNADPQLWQSTPEGNDTDGGFDYFLNFVMPGSRVPINFPHDAATAPLLTSATNVGGQPKPLLNSQTNYQSNTAVQLLTSKRIFDYNQGFCVRFYQEGRGSYRRGSILWFQFAEYVLVFNTTGLAELHQTADFTNYSLVYTFRWCDQSDVHDNHHRIIIFPHSRDKIEFLCGNEYSGDTSLLQGATASGVGRSGGGLYTIPGELIYDAANSRFRMTASAPIGIYASKEFRPYLQVSTLAFANGNSINATPGHAFLYDAPINLPFPPMADFRLNVQADTNGGTLEVGLYDPVLKQRWTPGKGSQQLQFAVSFQGTGKSDTDFSKVTPEFYGYSIRKDAQFVTIPRNLFYTWMQSANITKGETADSEKLTLTLDNSDGQVESFVDRSDIPLILYDADTGVIFFEGVADVDGTDNSSDTYRLTLQCRGMASDLHRRHWTEHAPDFAHDPDDPQGRGWYWSQVVYYCFAMGGIDRDRVIIENLNAGWDFRLPDKSADSGATASGKGDKDTGKGDGHVNDGNKEASWQPKWDSTPYEFLDYLLRGFLHWDFVYATNDRNWHIYKRPLPTDANYNQLVPKTAFFRDTTAMRIYQANNPDMACYTHSQMKFKNEKPKCTSILVRALLSEDHLLSKEALAAALVTEQTSGGTGNDSAFSKAERVVTIALTNPNGYPNPNATKNHLNNIDWLGHQRFRDLRTTAPNREALSFIARRAYYDHCFGRQTRTFDADWGDKVTAYLRKWDLIWIDTGRNAQGQRDGSLERWWLMSLQPAWTSDYDRRAGYHVVKFRKDCPPPFS